MNGDEKEEEKLFGKAPGKKMVRRSPIVKKCEVCGTDYHPRANGYEATSRFCSQACARKSKTRSHF
jgi:hypothetical protein